MSKPITDPSSIVLSADDELLLDALRQIFIKQGNVAISCKKSRRQKRFERAMYAQNKFLESFLAMHGLSWSSERTEAIRKMANRNT